MSAPLPVDPDLPSDDSAGKGTPPLTLPAVAAVALGACIGGPLRYAASLAWPVDDPTTFPWAIFAVNVAGAGLLGLLLIVVLESAHAPRYAREFAGIGMLGAFTTFSTWMLQTHDQVEADEPGLAVVYIGGSLVLGLLAAIAGMALGRLYIRRRGRSA